ncbi:MAG TPA: DCC1-like thiol-disulfide oxidoreductase family protein, partial [Anaeromyxobacteraceae bacterium]
MVARLRAWAAARSGGWRRGPGGAISWGVAAADDQPRALPPRIVLYDGACALCTGSVAWLVARDRGGLLRFAPLQGPTAARLRARDARIPAGLDGVVL